MERIGITGSTADATVAVSPADPRGEISDLSVRKHDASVAAAKIILCLWMVGVIVGAFLYAPPAHGFQNPGLARMLFFHVPNSIAGSVVSALSAWFALRYLISRRWIDDVRSRAMASLAMLFWILTTITGAMFAKVQWGAYWNWDPKQSAMFILLLLYMAYFALRHGVSNPEKQALVAAAYTVFATATVPFLTYVLPNSTTETLHPKGVVFSWDGMDTPYKLVFWSAVAGFLGLTTWMYRLQVRSARIERAVSRRFEGTES